MSNKARFLRVKSNYFLYHQFINMFWVLKRTVSEIKDANNFVSLLLFGKSSLPTSDQFNIIMFDNM